MTNDTPQELGRTSTAHDHDADPDFFCLRCITSDIDQSDFRRDLALLTAIDLKRLAAHRATELGASWRELWNDVLDPDRLQADLNSSDTKRRALVSRAQATVGDFLIYRRAVITSPHSLSVQLAAQLHVIEQRTWERIDTIEREGSEPELFGQLVN